MSIAIKSVVSIHYTLTDEDGEELDASTEREPLVYLHGAGNIIKGLELALLDKNVGDRVQATIAPEDGYGEFISELVQHVPLSVFGDEDKPEVGMRFNAETENGPLSVVVTAIDGDQAILNGNHPLAGKTITFDVTIENIREATPEELTHGHPHTAGGCGHHH